MSRFKYIADRIVDETALYENERYGVYLGRMKNGDWNDEVGYLIVNTVHGVIEGEMSVEHAAAHTIGVMLEEFNAQMNQRVDAASLAERVNSRLQGE